MSEHVTYAFAAGALGPRDLRVQRFKGQEGISELYRFDVEVVSSLAPQALEPLVLGHRARFAIRAHGKLRTTHGIVGSVRYGGPQSTSHPTFRYGLRLVPALWLLRKRAGSRVFRDMRVDEVIGAVAGGAGVATAFRLRSPLPKREYCTQFEETDYAFICRLAAENGLLFYFEQPPTALDGGLLDALDDATPVPFALSGLTELVPDLVARELHERVVFVDEARYPTIRTGDVSGDLVGAAEEVVQRALGALSGPLAAGADALAGALSPALKYRNEGALSADDMTLWSAFQERAIRETAATYREYDPARPRADLRAAERIGPLPSEELARSMLGSTAGVVQAVAAQAASAAGGLARGALANALGGELGEFASEALGAFGGEVEPHHLERYEHEGRDLYPSWERGRSEPRRILRQRRRRARTIRIESACPRVEAGHRFRVEDHPVEPLNREFVVVSARHEGSAQFHVTPAVPGYRNEVECVPADVPYVPQRPKRRSEQVCLTATVIGPGGDDIHVNDRGEIKVQFHWERTPPGDGGTCWIRTMHPWAGPSWGVQFIPRVGMEVIVVFEGGDPDKPIVLGSVYNGVTPPPFALPARKTRSGFRTKSSPNREGYNELSFEDAAGEEQIFVRAERDYDTVVQRDRTAKIERDERVQVKGNRSVDVERADALRADAREIRVASDSATWVGRNDTLRVGQDRTEEVAGARRAVVMHDDSRTVYGVSQSVIHDDAVLRVVGGAAVLIGREEARRSCSVVVEGPLEANASEKIELVSDKEIVLRVGTSSLRIGCGSIHLVADEITMAAKDARLQLDEGKTKLKVKDTFQVVSDDAIVLKSSGASLGLKTEAKLDGAQVLLNSPTQATDSIEASNPSPTTISLVDQNGASLPYTRFRAELSNGTVFIGFTDSDGNATLPSSASGHITFPELPDVEAH